MNLFTKGTPLPLPGGSRHTQYHFLLNLINDGMVLGSLFSSFVSVYSWGGGGGGGFRGLGLFVLGFLFLFSLRFLLVLVELSFEYIIIIVGFSKRCALACVYIISGELVLLQFAFL